ncbi:MAG: pyridoxal phosphate-dependent aminotransferase, partial [Chloroflexi bacterium]|nr:pyridoxal phosphate-dependent aminotransferase [Chloroflexota bacterium]
MQAEISDHFASRQPSPIRQAQILFAERADRDEIEVINLAIGNVSLPMHPAMRQRMATLAAAGSPFENGVVKYSPSVGTDEAQAAFINIIASTGANT